MKDAPWDAFATTLSLALITMVVFGWQRAALRRHQTSAVAESWQQGREHVRMPAASSQGSEIPEAVLEAVVRANPFSPQRRQIPNVTTGSPVRATQVSPPEPAPKFVYKGRILMGAKQRAVLEDVTSKKTYFLQLGQEVAGFTVLDIAENRVLLSDLHTQEEVVVPIATKPSP